MLLSPGVDVEPGLLQNALSNQPTFKLNTHWNKKALVLVTNEYQCTRCGRSFTEAENLGSWACSQHACYGQQSITSPFLFKPPVGSTWPCCGKKVILVRQSHLMCYRS